MNDKKPKPSFVALGDIHLSDTIWRSRPDVTGDAILGLKNLYNLAKRLGVPAVIVGDLFDTAEQRDPGCLVKFLRLTDEMADLGIPVYAIQGNHDKRVVPWYSSHEWVKHVGDGEPFILNGLHCLGFDYDIQDRIKSKLELITGEFDILFLHQAVKQALKFEGAWNCDLLWTPVNIPLIVMGDIHTDWGMKFRDNQYAAYTNAGHPRSVSEFGPKNILQVNSDLSITRVDVPTRPMRAWVWLSGVDLEIETWLRDQAPMALESGLQPFVHLTYSENSQTEIDGFKAKVYGYNNKVLWGAAVVPEHGRASSGTLETSTAGEIPSARDILSRRITDPQALNLAIDLVSTKNVLTDILLAHRTEFIKGYTC